MNSELRKTIEQDRSVITLRTQDELLNGDLDALKELEKKVWNYYSKVNACLRFRRAFRSED